MQAIKVSTPLPLRALALAAILLCAAWAGPALSQEIKVALSGMQEIPPVTTAATGTGTVNIGADKSLSGGVTVAGLEVTAAHIHEAGPGKNGPIVVPLTKVSDTVWNVPPGTKLTDAQYESYRAGNLYFNIHSAAHKAGEIRGQIKP